MSGKTAKLNLILPELDEYYDIGVHNDNYSIIDEVLGEHRSNEDNPHNVTKAQVGLGKVNNTSDMDKPVSTAVKATIDAHTDNKLNPHNVTKSQIGLSNVDNTSDVDKPISTAVQTAINALNDRVSKGATIITINADTFSGSNTSGGYPYKEIYNCNSRIVYLGLLQGYGTSESYYVSAVKECGLFMYAASASQGVIAVQVTDVSKLTEDIKIVIIDIGKYEGDNISAIVVNDLPSLNE